MRTLTVEDLEDPERRELVKDLFYAEFGRNPTRRELIQYVSGGKVKEIAERPAKQ